MAHATRLLTCAILLVALFAILPGCTGFGGTSNGDSKDGGSTGTVNVLLQYTDAAVTRFPGDIVVAKLPDLATRFRVELVSPNTGLTVLAVVVDRQPGDSQTVTFTTVPVGAYVLKVTAFDAGGNNLGVSQTTITVQTGTNTFPIPSVTPVSSPTTSPSPSPSPSVSPSPSPSPSPT